MPAATPERREYMREYMRRYYEKNPRDPAAIREANLRACHGITLADKSAMLDAQGGRCYLCGDPLTLDDAYIDHDHSCCRPPGRRVRSCTRCRRGLACNACNLIVGMAQDDPARLGRIAGSLAAVAPAVRARIAGKPQQATLFDLPKAS